MEEKPKFNITPKPVIKLNITEKKSPKLNIREIFPAKIREMVENHGLGTLKVDPHFGQTWNLSNISTEDVFYFGSQYYKDRDKKDISEKIDTFYQTLLRMNPELQNIGVENKERLLDVIRGVGSGLHFNDIKYFVEELKGNANNEPAEMKTMDEQVMEAYLKRNGIDTDKDESQFSQEELKRVDEL